MQIPNVPTHRGVDDFGRYLGWPVQYRNMISNVVFAILEEGQLVLMKNSPVVVKISTLKVQTILHFFDDIGLNTL